MVGVTDADPLAAYRRRMRPRRIGYAIAVVVALAVSLLVVKIAYSHGEISHATLHTAASPAPSVQPQQPAASLARAWQTADRPAIGMPAWGGTVVTYSKRSVTGRDGRTGAVAWEYTRTDRTVCTAAQIQGVTIAVYELAGNCDELTALDSQTGKREWTRTLDKDGQPLNGRPAYSVTPYTFMLTSPHAIYAVDPVSGLDRWVFDERGCTVRSAILGSSGALISQDCTHPQCKAGQKFCGAGVQLLLRDATQGENHDDNTNPDQIKWNRLGNTLQPACADGVICALRPGATSLSVFDPTDGHPLPALPLAAPAGPTSAVAATAHGDLLWTGGRTYAVQEGGSKYFWHAATASLPTVSSLDGSQPPFLPHAVIAVGTTGGVETLDANSGRVTRTIPLPDAATATTVAVLGPGLVLAGPWGTAAYR